MTKFKAGDQVTFYAERDVRDAKYVGVEDRPRNTTTVIRIERFPSERGVLAAYCEDFTYYPVSCLELVPALKFPIGTPVVTPDGVGIYAGPGEVQFGMLIIRTSDDRIEEAARDEWVVVEWRHVRTKRVVMASRTRLGQFLDHNGNYHPTLNAAKVAVEKASHA